MLDFVFPTAFVFDMCYFFVLYIFLLFSVFPYRIMVIIDKYVISARFLRPDFLPCKH